MTDPRQIVLNRVKFHEDMQTISYHYTLDGQRRIIAYHADGDQSVQVGVRETPDGAPLVQLLATRDGIRAHTPQGEFKLVQGRRVLPPSTDHLAIWLLAQDPAKNTTLMPSRILDHFLDAPGTPNGSGGQTEADMAPWLGLPGALWNLVNIWNWLGGNSGNCLDPNQTTQCGETDANGKSTVVTFQCECGTPICNQISTQVDVAVVVVDASTGDKHTETESRTIVQCACYCMELEVGTGGPA